MGTSFFLVDELIVDFFIHMEFRTTHFSLAEGLSGIKFLRCNRTWNKKFEKSIMQVRGHSSFSANYYLKCIFNQCSAFVNYSSVVFNFQVQSWIPLEVFVYQLFIEVIFLFYFFYFYIQSIIIESFFEYVLFLISFKARCYHSVAA